MVLDSTGPPPGAYALIQARLHLFHYLRNFIWPLPIWQAPAVLLERWMGPRLTTVVVAAAILYLGVTASR